MSLRPLAGSIRNDAIMCAFAREQHDVRGRVIMYFGRGCVFRETNNMVQVHYLQLLTSMIIFATTRLLYTARTCRARDQRHGASALPPAAHLGGHGRHPALVIPFFLCRSKEMRFVPPHH